MDAELAPRRTGRVVARPGEARLDAPMDEQIRITANRRCEVRVRIVTEAEMPRVIRAVHGLLQGTQKHGLQQVEIGSIANLGEQTSIVVRAGMISACKTEAGAP